MDIWQNADGRRVVIESSENGGYVKAVMYRDNMYNKAGGLRVSMIGKPVRKDISPYYIFSDGIGAAGRASNARIRGMHVTRAGTRADAIRDAYKYMRGGK